MSSAPLRLAPGIEFGEDVVSGAPVLEGTRIPVWAVVRALADLGTVEAVARAYEIGEDQVTLALQFGADTLEETRIVALK